MGSSTTHTARTNSVVTTYSVKGVGNTAGCDLPTSARSYTSLDDDSFCAMRLTANLHWVAGKRFWHSGQHSNHGHSHHGHRRQRTHEQVPQEAVLNVVKNHHDQGTLSSDDDTKKLAEQVYTDLTVDSLEALAKQLWRNNHLDDDQAEREWAGFVKAYSSDMEDGSGDRKSKYDHIVKVAKLLIEYEFKALACIAVGTDYTSAIPDDEEDANFDRIWLFLKAQKDEQVNFIFENEYDDSDAHDDFFIGLGAVERAIEITEEVKKLGRSKIHPT
eukprot:gnl/TRDRNA2_/TRDRNA2_154684_c0_seq1.p1 gnl/TRDRNA2_/TRDRNA2_154684_c0~~gnl/TRDRNA2_/TRDRNA2_154684_c0_seq1.p1  ORF type:complete len:273 (+),score=35.11 gnl/TRDRNA2_/TRDRNA2_154684_c0_seq1:99-917(+)